MKDFIKNNSNHRSISILLFMYIIFNIILIPNIFPSGEKPIDLQMTYSVETAYTFIEKCSENNQHSYMLGEIIIDTVYPIVVSLLLSVVIYVLYGNMNLATSLPLMVLVSDYLENLGILTLLYTYGFTSLKWLVFGICLIIILFGLLRRVYFKYKNREEC
jgi:hypothetical protein